MLKNKTIGAYIQGAAALMALVSVVLSAASGHNSTGVTLFCLGACVCGIAYLLVNHVLAELLNYAALALVTCGLCTYVVGSIATLLDFLFGITMFGTDGNIAPLVPTMLVMLISMLCSVVSCFMKRSR